VTPEHLEFQSFTPNAQKYLQQLAVSYGDAILQNNRQKNAQLSFWPMPQRTGKRIEHGTPPEIKPKYQNLDTHGNKYYFLLIF
jgi:hypothetical protein